MKSSINQVLLAWTPPTKAPEIQSDLCILPDSLILPEYEKAVEAAGGGEDLLLRHALLEPCTHGSPMYLGDALQQLGNQAGR